MKLQYLCYTAGLKILNLGVEARLDGRRKGRPFPLPVNSGINVRFFFFFFKAYLGLSPWMNPGSVLIQIIEKSGLRELLVSKSQFWWALFWGEEMKRCETQN